MSTNPDELVALGTYPNEFVAGVMRVKLEEAGIPAQVIAANQALIGFWGLARWVPYTVWVRRADAEQAMATLEAVREEQGTVDWDAEDVGDPEPGDEIARRIASGEVRGFGRHAKLGLAGGLLIASLIVPVWSVSLVLLLGASLLALPVLFGKKGRPRQAE